MMNEVRKHTFFFYPAWKLKARGRYNELAYFIGQNVRRKKKKAAATCNISSLSVWLMRPCKHPLQ